MPTPSTLAYLFNPRVLVRLTLVLIAVMSVMGDASVSVRRIKVTYVGTGSERSDMTFDRFIESLKRLPPKYRDDLGIDYLPVRDSDLSTTAEDLRRSVNSTPDVWVAPTATIASAVRQVDDRQRLVFASYPDPVHGGLVHSLSRPGGRSTGLWLGDDLDGKRLELLKDAFPGVRTVGVLVDRSWTETADVRMRLTEPATALGLHVTLWIIDDPVELDQTMSQPEAASMDAWYVPPTYIAYRCEAAIIEHIRRLQRPSIHTTMREVEAGALMAYSLDASFAFDALAALVVRVAAGDDPAELPVQRPRRYTLSLRPLATPPGLVIAPAVVLRADRIF